MGLRGAVDAQGLSGSGFAVPARDQVLDPGVSPQPDPPKEERRLGEPVQAHGLGAGVTPAVEISDQARRRVRAAPHQESRLIALDHGRPPAASHELAAEHVALRRAACGLASDLLKPKPGPHRPNARSAGSM
jgi:hypothetical protein